MSSANTRRRSRVVILLSGVLTIAASLLTPVVTGGETVRAGTVVARYHAEAQTVIDQACVHYQGCTETPRVIPEQFLLVVRGKNLIGLTAERQVQVDPITYRYYRLAGRWTEK
jgi:hypothetical protein